MKTKITLLVLTALLGLTNVFANSIPGSENNVENEIMTTGDNSIIISAGKRIYTLDMNTYQATLLATSPYVNEINSIASSNATGWIFYVSNHISSYNWTIYGYNVYTNTHKNFGSVRHFFTSTGHAYSSRGLASGGATFYNGKLYFAMEYPAYCYSYRDGRSATSNQNPKDELPNNVRAAGTVSNTMFTNGPTTRGNAGEDDTVDTGGRTGDGETPADFEIIEAEEANTLNDLVSDYVPEQDLPANTTSDDGLAQRGTSNAESGSSYYSSSYNNYMYLLEISFNGLSDASGATTSVANGRPVYDNWGYSSFLYRGELGDIVVDDNGQLYAATSYQVQAYNFNSNRYDWANNEDVYAQMAKDKHSALQLLKNKRQCSTTYYNGCPHTSCTTKSFVQGYTAPSYLRTYNSIQLGSLNEITGLNSYDVGKITDASDYIRLTPPVSYKIKGFVFDDNNENGSFNSGQGETKLAGVQVTLYADNNEDGVLDAGDTVITSQNTDASGNYTFNDVQIQKTIVEVTVPSDDTNFTYTLTTPQTVSVTGATSDITGIKFGINKAEVVINVAYDIFGTVYDDNNENAALETGEPGLNNVSLTLYADNNTDGILDAGDTVITTTTSGTDGSYSFLHVCIQHTIVAVTVPSNNGNFTYTLTTPATQAIDSINTNVTGVDFGINELQVIDYNVSGTVYDDNNENAVFETGEGTLEGVTVTLYADNNTDGTLDAGDTVITSTNTGVTGAYSFANVTVANTVVAVTVPTNTGDFTYTLTTASSLDSSSTTTDVTGRDFGINKLQVIDYNISGNVYDDNDESGAQDAGEDNLNAITVTLYADNNANGTVDAGDTVITSAVTGVDGTYNFSNVTAEFTVVAVTVPSNNGNFTYTLTTAGELNTSSTNIDVLGINFGINEVQVIDYNISGTVFDDNNENGTEDAGEAGLNGVTITLYADNNADGILDVADTAITTTTTAVDGTYSFSNITTPNVLAVISTPGNTATFTYTLTTAGTLAASSTITDVTGLDFGVNEEEVILYNISGTVFDDDNENGVNDSEAGLDGVTVKLYADNDASGTLTAGDGLLEITSTGVGGTYSFTNVTTQFTLVGVTVPTNTPDFTYTATTPIMLAVSSTINDVNNQDFGVNQIEIIDYNISGVTFEDINADGVNDNTDGRVQNVVVRLYEDINADGSLDGSDNLLRTTATGSSGTYQFSNVGVKNTLVKFTIPSNNPNFNFSATTPDTISLLNRTTDATNVDFGINKVQVIDFNISGTVFDDNNENGAQDAGEGVLDGITITLYADNNADGILDVADTTITTTTTAVDGTYSFSNITTPDVLAVISVPGNTATFTYTLTTAGTQAASSTITDVTGLDFGVNQKEVILYNISGNVFDDNNGNGVRDAGEGFIGATLVTLYADNNNDGILDAGDTVISTRTTSTMTGNYSFVGVTVRNTLVVVSVPGNTATFTYVPTTSTQRAVSSTITNVPNVNFGIDRVQIVNYNISGTVFDDDNANGTIDTAEAGRLQNVTLTLYADTNNDGTLDAGDTVITTTTSAANGTYAFNGVTVQQTLVEVTVPGNTSGFNYVLTTSAVQTVNSTIAPVTGVDFGINQTSASYAITGNVFNDTNGDGNKTGDGGLTGVTVRVYADTNQNGRVDRGEPVIATALSDRDGNYQFTGLTNIFVVVQVVVPANTAQFQYTSTTPVNVALSSGITTTVDFGITRSVVALYNVRGVVWDDDNADQIKDAVEARLEGVEVKLYNDVNQNGTLDAGDVQLSTAFTSITGAYEFINVNVGSVIVESTLPSNGTFTTPGARAISSINTDANNIDFGIDVVATLFEVTGVVFDDDNENGIFDVGEGSLNGLTVEIYADTDDDGLFDPNFDALIAFTQTNNGGFEVLDPNYIVDNVTQGRVHIVVVIPAPTAFISYTPTFDPDSGTTNPDGVFTTFMTASISQTNFGMNYRDLNATSRVATTDDVLFTNGGVTEDVSERLRLYPNPTVRQIAINAQEFEGAVTVEIYNDRGYKVLTSTVSSFGDEYKVDVQRLAPGMYYAKFTSSNKVASKKFIKK